MKPFCQACCLFFFILLSGICPPHARAGDMEAADAELEEELKWLREEAEARFVTVATKTKMTADQAPSIVSVITAQEIRNMGARDIIDVLRTVPGFDFVRRGNWPLSQIYIRGLTSSDNEKVKIMINGHTMQVTWDCMAEHFDRLPIGSIKRIEIIRGPGSALYGTSAFLGVINIITKEGGDEPSRVSFEYGSYDTAKPSAELSLKDDNLKTYMYAEYYRTDGYDGTIESDAAEVFHLIPSASREMSDKTEYQTVQTKISYDRLYFSGFFQKLRTQAPVGLWSVLTDEDDIETLSFFGELGYTIPMGSRGSLQMKGYYDFYDYIALLEPFPEETASEMYIGFPEGQKAYLDQRAKLSLAGAQIAADYKPYPGIRLVAGTSYEYFRQYDVKTYKNYNEGESVEIGGVTYEPYQYFPEGMTDISETMNWNKKADRNITAVYAQGIFDLKKIFSMERAAENLTLTLGGRYDHYDDMGSSTNPRLGIVWAPTEKLWLKGLYGKGFRVPSFLILYMNGWGNTELTPEYITTYEGSVGYHFTQTLSGSLTGFYAKGKDLIQHPGETWENIGKTESYGLEAELKAAFGRNKYAYLNLTWQDVRDTTHSTIISEGGQTYTHGDFHPGTAPEFYGNIGLNYGFTGKIIGNISLNYAGERDRSEEKIWVGETLIRKDQRDPVKERWLLNASLTFRDFLFRGTEFQISGFNLLDQDYRDPEPNGYILNDIPGPGRSFRGRISYSF